MIIFLPVLIPLGAQLGIDPIQFGAVVVLNLMIGLMHPPIGLLLFVVSSVGKIRIAPVMWEILPFLAWALIELVLTTVFPALSTWLRGQLRRQGTRKPACGSGASSLGSGVVADRERKYRNAA